MSGDQQDTALVVHAAAYSAARRAWHCPYVPNRRWILTTTSHHFSAVRWTYRALLTGQTDEEPIMRYRVNLLDMWIDKIDIIGAVSQIDTFVRAGRPHQVMTVNVDFLRLGRENPAFQHLINTADLAVPDGMPLLWAARLRRDPLPARVTGVDLIVACATLAAAKGYTIFLVGAGPGVAAAAAAVLQARCPGVRIVGTYAPPLGSAFDHDENETTVRLIREARPDMLFVAFGAPTQDEWIRTRLQRLDVPVCMGVGGAFDLLAGRVRRAPAWMQRAGLEWLYRVAQEPTRLWKRYLVDDLPVVVRLLAPRRPSARPAHAVAGLRTGPASPEVGGGSAAVAWEPGPTLARPRRHPSPAADPCGRPHLHDERHAGERGRRQQRPPHHAALDDRSPGPAARRRGRPLRLTLPRQARPRGVPSNDGCPRPVTSCVRHCADVTLNCGGR